MAHYGDEQKAMDAAIHGEHVGLVLQTAGWTLLVFCSLPALFLFVGWRSGSLFWFWLLSGLGAVGLGLVAGGTYVRSRSAKDFATLSGAMRSRATPSLRDDELPPPEDVDHRAA